MRSKAKDKIGLNRQVTHGKEMEDSIIIEILLKSYYPIRIEILYKNRIRVLPKRQMRLIPKFVIINVT